MKKKKPPPKKIKKGAKTPPAEFEGFDGHYPPAGHGVEFDWGGDWYKGEFIKMEVDADGDELCRILDDGTKEVHKVLFRELGSFSGDWLAALNGPPYSTALFAKLIRGAILFAKSALSLRTAIRSRTSTMNTSLYNIWSI